MDLAILTRDLVSALGPALPFLVPVGQGAAGQVVAEATLTTAKKLWAKVHPKIENKPAAIEAVMDVAAYPDDADAQAALRLQFRKLLADDAGLADELAAIIVEARSTGNASGERSVAVGGEVSGTIITGDNNTVQRGKYNIRIDKASGLAIGDNSQVTTSALDEDEG